MPHGPARDVPAMWRRIRMPARSPFSRSVIGAGAALISATLVANVVVAAEAGSAPGGEGASSAGIAAPSSPSPDRDIAGLLMTAESQIAAGHLNAPVGDNATDTLQAVLRRAVLAPQSARDVIDRMASRFEERALAAEAAGDAEQAARFRAFRDAFAFPHLEPRKDSVTQAQSLATLGELPRCRRMPPRAGLARIVPLRTPRAPTHRRRSPNQRPKMPLPPVRGPTSRRTLSGRTTRRGHMIRKQRLPRARHPLLAPTRAAAQRACPSRRRRNPQGPTGRPTRRALSRP